MVITVVQDGSKRERVGIFKKIATCAKTQLFDKIYASPSNVDS